MKNTMTWILRIGLVSGLLLALGSGCSRQPSDQTETQNPSPTPPPPVASTPAKGDTPGGPATNASPTPSTKSAPAIRITKRGAAATAHSADVLEQSYRAAQDPKRKTEILYQIADLNNRQAVETLSALFQTETDPSLKEEMVNVLDLIDEHEREKLDLLAVAVLPHQPHELRLAAIDSLGDLEAPQALKVLKSLLKDSNEEIREAAEDAIEFFEATALPD